MLVYDVCYVSHAAHCSYMYTINIRTEHYVSNPTTCVCENPLLFCYAVLSFISNLHSNTVVSTSLYKVQNYFDVSFYLYEANHTPSGKKMVT